MPGTALEVQALTERLELVTDSAYLLVLLEGQLIVDLPAGDFRVLTPGDSLQLGAELAVALQPVAGQAVLTWHAPR